jgi:X-X-X-Leu-X-X-Gly heptad repeat protein
MNIDHKEDTDGAVIVRGILCNRCNTMLGTYNDSSSELSDKITQLESKLKQLTSLNSYLSENLAFKTGKVKQ